MIMFIALFGLLAMFGIIPIVLYFVKKNPQYLYITSGVFIIFCDLLIKPATAFLISSANAFNSGFSNSSHSSELTMPSSSAFLTINIVFVLMGITMIVMGIVYILTRKNNSINISNQEQNN